MADDKDLANKKAAFEHPLFVPEEFKGWLNDFGMRVATDLFTQDIQGLRGARWKSASPIVDPDACSITSGWGDCDTTVGPTLTGLSDGLWMVLWGFAALDAFTHSTVIFINGDYADGRGVPGNHDFNELFTTRGGSCMGAGVWNITKDQISQGGTKTLDGGFNNNTIEVKYFVSAAGARFEKRWMHAIRVDELVKVVA
jgi:hypothetical protein